MDTVDEQQVIWTVAQYILDHLGDGDNNINYKRAIDLLSPLLIIAPDILSTAAEVVINLLEAARRGQCNDEEEIKEEIKIRLRGIIKRAKQW